MSAGVGVIGVPTSAGAFAPGQEQAPDALRAAGLVGELRGAGLAVTDHGDCETWRWRPDRENVRAQNLGKVVEIVQGTALRVAEAVDRHEVTLVLGGDCTVGIGTVAGHVATGRRVGIVYFDTHADMNVPDSVREGALDWMGVAHMLGEHGASAALVGAGPRTPLVEPDQIVLFGWGPEQATAFERQAIARRGLAMLDVDRVARDPAQAAVDALAMLEQRCDALLVHFDADVIDFTDTPLSENWGRNEGLAFDDAACALALLLGSPKLAGITVTELNPDHVEPGARSLERLVATLTTGIARSFVARAAALPSDPAGASPGMIVPGRDRGAPARGAAASSNALADGGEQRRRGVELRLAGIEAVDRFEPLWRALDDEHRRVGPQWPQWWDRARSWQIRRARYREWLSEPGAFALLAENSSAEAVGYCVAHMLAGPDDSWRSGSKIADIESLCVLPGHRGDGLGSRLFEATVEEAKRRGADDIWIGVVAGNESAMRFYRRHGLLPVMTTVARFGLDDA